MVLFKENHINNNMDNYMLSDTKMPIQSCLGFFRRFRNQQDVLSRLSSGPQIEKMLKFRVHSDLMQSTSQNIPSTPILFLIFFDMILH